MLAAGCGTTISTTAINPAPRAARARPAHTVQIFSSGPPSQPYVDVAYLEAEQDTGFSFDDTPEFFQRLRERAGQLGCDGVVVGHITHRADALTSAATDVHTSRKGMTATCIMYTSDPSDAIATNPAPRPAAAAGGPGAGP